MFYASRDVLSTRTSKHSSIGGKPDEKHVKVWGQQSHNKVSNSVDFHSFRDSRNYLIIAETALSFHFLLFESLFIDFGDRDLRMRNRRSFIFHCTASFNRQIVNSKILWIFRRRSYFFYGFFTVFRVSSDLSLN